MYHVETSWHVSELILHYLLEIKTLNMKPHYNLHQI